MAATLFKVKILKADTVADVEIVLSEMQQFINDPQNMNFHTVFEMLLLDYARSQKNQDIRNVPDTVQGSSEDETNSNTNRSAD